MTVKIKGINAMPTEKVLKLFFRALLQAQSHGTATRPKWLREHLGLCSNLHQWGRDQDLPLPRRAELEDALDDLFRNDFGDPVLPFHDSMDEYVSETDIFSNTRRMDFVRKHAEL